MAKTKKQKPTDVDYERFGKLLVNVGQLGYANKKRFYIMNLLRGVAVGVGSVIGATLGIAILLYILSLLGEVPLVGEVADSIKSTIDSNQ